MHIQLMTDGSADLPTNLKRDLQIKVIPLYVNFGEEQYNDASLDLNTFYQKLRNNETFPRSAAPAPHEFYQAFKEVDPSIPIIMLCLSSGISSTYNHARMGMDMLLEQEPNRKIEVINSKTASSGLILLLDEASQKLQAGYDFEQLVEHLYDRVEHTTTLFILKTLENLVRGGRLDKVKGAIAKSLNIKLLMRASHEGTIEVTEKVRGNKKSIRRFIEQIGDYTKTAEEKVIAMTHCNAEDRAKTVLDEITQAHPFKKTILSEMGPTISTHAGEGGLVIAFFSDQ
ncbi:DegV family protein [Aquibacillus sediminis]|uniref:DegV family protein n=1 Tax=Aquibacillus sediminis TaxID=2574734 RepID=UPI0011097972|nr:DegV family protein [Aquibacillus sediminis]